MTLAAGAWPARAASPRAPGASASAHTSLPGASASAHTSLPDTAAGSGPVLLLPARAKSAPPDTAAESPPAPFIIPGRPAPADTAQKTRAQRALDEVRLGLAFEQAGSPGTAITSYRNAVMLDPMVPEAYYRMGRLFMAVGELQQAVSCFTQEVAHHPGHTDAGRQLGLALARSGDYPHAIEELRLLTRRDSSDAESWSALGFAYVGAKRPKDAEHALRRAIRLSPRRSSYHRDLGVVLAGMDRVTEARAEYRTAQTLDPHDASVWINLGNLELRENALEAALAAYRAAEASDSSLALAIHGQAQTLHHLGRDTEAGAVYRRWLARRPDDFGARLETVRFFGAIGRTDIALEIARDGVRHAPRSGDAHLALGMALHAAHDVKGGLEEVRKAESLFRSRADRERVRALIASLRAGAPDSLRALFVADSLAHLQAPVEKPGTR